MRADPRLFYLSDGAYDYLITKAQHNGWLPWGTKRVKGISPFLCKLATYEMEDTRPDLVRQRHEEEIQHNHAPTWLHNKMRRSRMLMLTDDAVARYLLIAHIMGIIKNEPWATGGPDMRTPYPTVSLVLEAIGLRWITPVAWPSKHD